jgi:hypothetical protein
MADPYFRLRQEVHVVRNHCASCGQLESLMQHPIRVGAIMAYGEESTYRIEDAKGASTSMKHAFVAVLQATVPVHAYSAGTRSCS